eukprot:2441676-Rhodomonas_salina.1
MQVASTSEFVITPRLAFHPLPKPKAFKFPPHLRDEIVAPPTEVCAHRKIGVDLLFHVYESFVVPEDQPQDAWHDLFLGMSIRLFDACLASQAVELKPYQQTPLLAGACLLASSKCVPVSLKAHCGTSRAVCSIVVTLATLERTNMPH